VSSPEGAISEIMDAFKKKIEGGILPPDPARVVKWVLDVYPEVEHITPLPPLVEHVHKEIVVPLIEKLPRLPMTAEFPFKDWEKYKIERW